MNRRGFLARLVSAALLPLLDKLPLPDTQENVVENVTALSNGEIADLVQQTLRDLDKLRYQDIIEDMQNYVAFKKLLTARALGGKAMSIKWNCLEGKA